MPAINWSDTSVNLKPTPAWRFFATLPTGSGTLLNGQTLSFYVERMSAPQVGVNFEPAAYNAGERQFPTMRTIGQIMMVLAEDTDYSVIQYLRAWKNLVVDDQGNFGMPASYKQQISLQPYDETGNSAITFSWQGCAPIAVEAYDYDGSSTKHVSCSVTFGVDSMDPFQNSATSTPTTAGTSPTVTGSNNSITSPTVTGSNNSITSPSFTGPEGDSFSYVP